MNKRLKQISKNTRIWSILSIFVCLLIWVFQQMFFATSASENISIYSHQKKGNRAFLEYLQEKKIPVSVVYQPAYVWAKKMINRLETAKQIKKNTLNYKYIFVEKDGSFFWSAAEIIWFRRWIELGNDLIIFTRSPTSYWEALMLPIEYKNREQSKKAQRYFNIGFNSGIEKILRNFIFENISSSSGKETGEVSVQKCYLSESQGRFNIISNDIPYDRIIVPAIKESGWEKTSECRVGIQAFLWRWKYKEGNITFAYSPNMINNQLISDVDNILFIKNAIELSPNDVVIWDAYHHGVFQEPNLWFYIFHTIPGRFFIWLVIGFFTYLWYKNKKLRKYPLPRKEKELPGASLLYFHALASRFSKKEVINNAYETFQKYLNNKRQGNLSRVDDMDDTESTDETRHTQEKSTKEKLVFLNKHFHS